MLALGRLNIVECLILKGVQLSAADMHTYQALLSSNGYDKNNGPLRLRAFCYRMLNPIFHKYLSIDEKIAAIGTLELPHLISAPLILGLETRDNVLDTTKVFFQR
jgi:hypothetical protein